MATNKPQGNLVGWRINMKHFQRGNPLKFLPWIKKKNCSTHVGCAAVGFEPTTSQSLSGGVTPRLTHYLNHSATEHWYLTFQK